MPLDLIQIIAQAALEKKAKKVSVYDLRGCSDLCEVQIICSGDNERQVIAICDSIEEKAKKMFGQSPIGVEGKALGNWILIDYGSVIVHIFQGNYRDYYGLDTLWPQAKTIPVSVGG